MEFDETQAIKYMRRSVPEASGYDDDELFNVIDMIFDYYESNGMLEIDLDDDADTEPETDDIIAYVCRMLARDKGAKLDAAHAGPLVRAYLDYENSLA